MVNWRLLLKRPYKTIENVSEDHYQQHKHFQNLSFFTTNNRVLYLNTHNIETLH
jgi:hypothetical protein